MNARNTKKDAAPRGVFRQGKAWAVRYRCGAAHVHEETVGPVKGEAIRAHSARRARALAAPGWCPRVERGLERKRAAGRVLFSDYAAGYLEWAMASGKRSWAKDRSRLNSIKPVFGNKRLDEITTAEIERFLHGLMDGRAPATVNRFRDQLSGMFKRAIRLGLVTANPVKGIPKLKELGGRLIYLPPASPGRPAYEEDALRDALPPELRADFTVSVHTGLRWSEQAALEWRDVDMLVGSIGVGRSKNGYGRRVPMNSVVRSALMDLATERRRPDDATARVCRVPYRTAARLFGKAVQRAQEALRDAGKDAGRLDGFTWHGLRHSFATRLVMNGVDLLTVKELGGWRTLAMVQRYAHLAPQHLRAAVEGLVNGAVGAVEVGLKLDSAKNAAQPRPVSVS